MESQTIKVHYDRLFSTGNYEHMKIGLEVECSEAELGTTFQKLVATAVALKENGLQQERRYLFEESAKKRIKELQDELAGLQAQLPGPENRED